MPRYQCIKPFFLNGYQYDNQTQKSLLVNIDDVIDYSLERKEYYFKGTTAQKDLTLLVTDGYLINIGDSTIYDPGIAGVIHASDIIFDPTGNIQSTNVQDAIVETYQESLQPTFVNEPLPVTSNGQTLFLLSQTPISNQSVSLFVNSAVYINGIDFTVNVDIITWLNRNFTLTTQDEVAVSYLVDLG